MNNKMGLLTMCRKAGKLKLGMDMTKTSCNSGEAVAVFVATDFSPKSLKEVKFVCHSAEIPIFSLGVTMDDMWYGIGKRVGVITITDSGFAKSCAKGLDEIEIDENEFYSSI